MSTPSRSERGSNEPSVPLIGTTLFEAAHWTSPALLLSDRETDSFAEGPRVLIPLPPAASQVRTRAGAGCEKLCERTDIDANGVAPEGEGFYKRRASPPRDCQTPSRWPGEYLDGRSSKRGTETGGVLVEAVR